MTRTPHRSTAHPLAPQPRRVTVRTRAALALVAAAGAGLLGACSYTSPPTAVEPYTAADGVNATAQVGDATLKLQNLLIVSAGKGGPGQLVGAVASTGNETVGLQVVAGSGKAEVAVKPGELTLFGPTGTPLLFEVNTEAGSRMNIDFVTSDGGHQTIAVPVLPPTGYYASLSPSPTPSASTTPTGDSPSPTGSPSPTATP